MLLWSDHPEIAEALAQPDDDSLGRMQTLNETLRQIRQNKAVIFGAAAPTGDYLDGLAEANAADALRALRPFARPTEQTA